jgi:hypothetical protein
MKLTLHGIGTISHALQGESHGIFFFIQEIEVHIYASHRTTSELNHCTCKYSK